MRSAKSSFAARVSKRADKLESEAEVAYERSMRWKAAERVRKAELALQQETRAAREHNGRGYFPEEVWGKDSAEAKVCNEFIAFMAMRDFPGSKLLTHKERVSRPFLRRWLKKGIVETPEVHDEAESTRGYGIGYTLDTFDLQNCRRFESHDTYPYKRYHQDIFLCEDRMIYKFSQDTLSPLDSESAPDQPQVPRIGAIDRDRNHHVYRVVYKELDDLLVQIATYHTQMPTESQQVL